METKILRTNKWWHRRQKRKMGGTNKQVDHFPSNTSLSRQQYLIMFIVSVRSYPSVCVPSCPSLLADIYNCYSIAHMSPLWLLHSSSVLQILQASGGNIKIKTHLKIEIINNNKINVEIGSWFLIIFFKQ